MHLRDKLDSKVWPLDDEPKNFRSREESTVGRQSTKHIRSVNKVLSREHNRPAASTVDPRSYIGRPADLNGT